jgi:uncharacterized protein
MAVVGVLHLELHLDYATTIKDKRNVLRSLKARLRSRHNVAVAGIGHRDSMNHGLVGVVAIPSDRVCAEGRPQKAEDEAAALLEAVLVGSGVDWIE